MTAMASDHGINSSLQSPRTSDNWSGSSKFKKMCTFPYGSSSSSSSLEWETTTVAAAQHQRSLYITPREDAAICILDDDGDSPTTPAATAALPAALVAVGGRTTETTSLSCVELFDTRRREWSALPSLSTPRCGCSVASMKNRIYVFGGLSDTNDRLSSCESLDLVLLESSSLPVVKNSEEQSPQQEHQSYCWWEPEVSMSSSRWYGAAVSFPLHGDIVVLGGRDDQWQELSSVQAYDTNAQEWSDDLASMSSPRFGCGATRIAPSKLIVAGGFDGTTWLDTAEIYDYESNEWSPILSKMPGALEFCTATLLGTHHVLVSGGTRSSTGRKGSTKFYVYNLLQETWSTIKTGLKLDGTVCIAAIGSQALALDQTKKITHLTSNLMALVEDDLTEATSRSSSTQQHKQNQNHEDNLIKRSNGGSTAASTNASEDYEEDEDDASTPWWTAEAHHSSHSRLEVGDALLSSMGGGDQVSVLDESDLDARSANTSSRSLLMAPPFSPSPNSPRSGRMTVVPFSPGTPSTSSGRRKGIRRCSVDQIITVDPSGNKVRYTGHVSKSHSRPHGQGTMRWMETGDVYTGSFRHGHMEGFGQLDSANGDRYEGLFEKGLKNGKGIFRSQKEGRTYDGNFSNNLRHDPNGTLTWVNGTIYMGAFVEGKRTGKGVQRFPTGVRYQGDFLAGKYHGFGVCEFADGSIYRGDWFQGKAHGHGRLAQANGEVLHDGQWESDGPVYDDDQ